MTAPGVRRARRRGSVLLLLSVLLVALASCAQENYPEALWLAQHSTAASSPATSDASAPAVGAVYCKQPLASPLPQRLVTMSATVSSAGNLVLASDLFQQFNEVCTPCHTAAADPPGQGGFQIATESDFTSKMSAPFAAPGYPSDDTLPINHVLQSVCPSQPDPASPADPMPPCFSQAGGTYTQRSSTDPVKQFAEEVQAWLAAGSPPSFTYPPSGDGGAASGSVTNSYALSVQNANAMTNLGTCIPSTALIGIDTQTMDAMDAKFAALQAMPTGTAAQVIGLPDHLGDTDLTTLDTQALAQVGVIAYQPAYPLWSDNAGKMRYVRVPRGTSIHYNAATAQFEIPPNTRFYKTFMRKIVDTDGSYRNRKVETRLIVSRPDVNGPNGAATAQTALFGTYQWNDEESDATLVETPLKDGKPFADTEFLYNVNEPLAADVLSSQPTDPEAQLIIYEASRHYAIPGSPRCIECHMGSPSQSFILGFTPLQVNRRPVGQGGVIETLGPDELGQLQRLIDAGIVTGLASPSDAPLLEQSQGTRTPRNYQELQAQGYMLGNCAHCHNARGYPTVTNPVLAPVLDFLPAPGPLGGIFQFPLERYSPRIERGVSGSELIPYVTPSLVDLPKTNPQTGGQATDWFVSSNIGASGAQQAVWINFAPWRSLIYRNTDNVFAYTDDYALFPHMPFNTPGYDPRAKEILGDWMVSIPAVRKSPQIVEYAYQVDSDPVDNIGSPVVDTNPQPYVEVLPGQPGYGAAVLAAQQRLETFHTGITSSLPLLGPPYVRYADPGQTADILDPAVVADPVCHPIPTGDPTVYDTPLAEHPDWVITDLTQPPGPYTPRQPDWMSILVQNQPAQENLGCASTAAAAAAYADELDAIKLVQSAALDQIRTYVTTPIPYGLWQQQPGCDYSSQPTVGSFTGAQRPHWMDVANPPASAPVYSQTPGAAVFKMICINCHGPDGAADGRLAQNLATMTGGNAIVADWRDGILGPVGATEAASNREAVWGTAALQSALAQSGVPQIPLDWQQAPDGSALTADDRAARYMAWMGLGGTAVNIPLAVLQIVSVTDVLGARRTLSANNLSANMLSEAKALCLGLIGPGYANNKLGTFTIGEGHGYLDAALTALNATLLPQNGDATMWLQMCSLGNPPPVHLLQFVGADTSGLAVPTIQDPNYNTLIKPGTLVASVDYPASTPVGNASGGIDASLTPDNEWPWCIVPTGLTSAQSALLASGTLPGCPQSVLTIAQECADYEDAGTGGCFLNDAVNSWAVRGAVNAGMSVFLYMTSIEGQTPPPDYDQCPN